MQRIFLKFSGNDTIDPYPLIPRETAKILCITLKTFTEISQSFNAFRKFIKPAVPQKCIEPKYPSEPKNNILEVNYQSDYEPTNAIYVNECNFRRWVRVKEWFNQFSPDAQKFEGTLLIQ